MTPSWRMTFLSMLAVVTISAGCQKSADYASPVKPTVADEKAVTVWSAMLPL